MNLLKTKGISILLLLAFLFVPLSTCSAGNYTITQTELDNWNSDLNELRSINQTLTKDLAQSKQELIQVRVELMTYQKELIQVHSELLQSSNELKLARTDLAEANKLLKESKESTIQLKKEVNRTKMERDLAIAGLIYKFLKG